jgi:glycosyltransferase involved in cell wall biosynthesis
MRKVIHLIPYHGIGGVETAARSVSTHREDGLDFEVRAIFAGVKESRFKWKTYNPLQVFRSARLIANESPDLLIMSLWRAALVGILVRALNRRVRMVLMIHNSVDAHPLDYIFTRWVMVYCTEVWADSAASISQRFNSRVPKPVNTISFLAHRLSAPHASPPEPVFMFWGRMSAQKNLGRAIKIFYQIHQKSPKAIFMVIGPDGGEMNQLVKLAHKLGISHAVKFLGPMNFDDIKSAALEASFYLQTSVFEGMAMSVVESMQLGLVPIVTPVGEIANYCEHRKSALLVDRDDKVQDLVLDLLQKPSSYQEMRQNAISVWENVPTYAESIVYETHRLLGKEA